MVTRIWHGATPASKSDEYLNLMRTVAIPDYRSTPGNKGAYALRRMEGDTAHFLMVTFWESVVAHQNARFFECAPAPDESSSSPKRSGGLSWRACQSCCCVLDAAMRANPSSASALIATAASATAAILAGSRHGRNKDALLTAATSKPNLAEKLTGYVSAPIEDANADLA
jgi:hypothetical protein